jgi:hypothetical protein
MRTVTMGSMIRRIGVPALAMLMLCSCQTSPEQRVEELNRLYAVGQDTRARMIQLGQPVSDQNCDKQFVALGHDNYTEAGVGGAKVEAFAEQRRVYFLNGCMDRPKSASPTDVPPSQS